MRSPPRENFDCPLRREAKKFARSQTAMNKALDGINLVEFDSNLGASYAAMLLAEQGARAVKVEPPGGARARGTAHFHALNRSKRALFLDLQAERARIERLLRWADAAVFGWTEARMRELGLDYAALAPNQSASGRAARSAARKPRPARRFRRQRRTGLGARRHLRQPVGAQRKSGGAAFPGRQLFGRRARRDCGGRGAVRAGGRRRRTSGRGLATGRRIFSPDGRHHAPRKDDPHV